MIFVSTIPQPSLYTYISPADLSIELVIIQTSSSRFELGYTIIYNQSQNNFDITSNCRNALNPRFCDNWILEVEKLHSGQNTVPAAIIIRAWCRYTYYPSHLHFNSQLRFSPYVQHRRTRKASLNRSISIDPPPIYLAL